MSKLRRVPVEDDAIRSLAEALMGQIDVHQRPILSAATMQVLLVSSARPLAVSCTDRVLRSNNVVPNSRSSCLIVLLNGGCAMCSRSPEVQFLSHCEEATQLSDVHVITSSKPNRYMSFEYYRRTYFVLD